MSEHPIVHIEVPSQEPSAAGRFYADLFGWQTMAMPMAGGEDYHGFRSQESLGGGFPKVDGQMVRPGAVVLYVGTSDIEATLAKAAGLGATTVVGKTEIPGMGWMAIFTDPTGNPIGLWTDASTA